MGEATHGTREFFQLKHRMLEFLATEMDFTIFSIEANMPEAYRLNDYVLNGNGDPAKLLKGMYFWTWDTQEVLDMIRWMREFNKSGKGRIEFTGFDMQFPDVAMATARDFVAKNDPEYALNLQKASDLARSAISKGTSQEQNLQMKSLWARAAKDFVDPKIAASSWQDVVQHLEANRSFYRSQGLLSHDIDWVIQNARVVLQCMQMKSGEVSRDQSMAENVKWIVDHNPGAKIVLWAHNGHVAFRGWSGSMGVALRRMFGGQMVVFGFAFNQGSFQAWEPGKTLTNFTVRPAPSGSLDATLAATGIPLFALDLRQAPNTGPVATWLQTLHQTRSIGALYSDNTAQGYYLNQEVIACYDALLFVETTTAAQKNPGRQ
jgi:erythromycin esterase